MDKIFKAVSDDVKERSAIQRELFRICYERKRNRYEEGYTSLVMNRSDNHNLSNYNFRNFHFVDWHLTIFAKYSVAIFALCFLVVRH